MYRPSGLVVGVLGVLGLLTAVVLALVRVNESSNQASAAIAVVSGMLGTLLAFYVAGLFYRRANEKYAVAFDSLHGQEDDRTWFALRRKGTERALERLLPAGAPQLSPKYALRLRGAGLEFVNLPDGSVLVRLELSQIVRADEGSMHAGGQTFVVMIVVVRNADEGEVTVPINLQGNPRKLFNKIFEIPSAVRSAVDAVSSMIHRSVDPRNSTNS